MLQGKMVRIRMRRNFQQQRLWVYVGRVEQADANLLLLNCKSLLIQAQEDIREHRAGTTMNVRGEMSGRSLPIYIDKEVRPIAVPYDAIANIRILPDDFDLNHIDVKAVEGRYGMTVAGAPDTWIGEMGES